MTNPVKWVRNIVVRDEDDRRRWVRSSEHFRESGLCDYLFADSFADAEPEEIFPRLRWGGQLVFASHNEREVEAIHSRYAQYDEFRVESEPQRGPWRVPLFGRRKMYYMVVRKVLLVPVDVLTDRYSYDVRLTPDASQPHGYLVTKRVPTIEEAIRRLRQRFPDATEETVTRGARKLVDKVFPLFLTREAVFLHLLQKKLPEEYAERFPKVIELKRDEHGFVRRMKLNWLRLGGEPLSQLEFAMQSAELLAVLHHRMKILHLDLRLDNFVITEHGVGFVDFGSAVRMDEDIRKSPMLSKLFHEMLSASQIQRDLHRFIMKGRVTSELFTHSHRKIHKGADLFYLVLQMNKPFLNPDFRGLINFDADSEEAYELAALTRDVLCPENPKRPEFRTAGDVLDGVQQIHEALR